MVNILNQGEIMLMEEVFAGYLEKRLKKAHIRILILAKELKNAKIMPKFKLIRKTTI